jgi:hypothetical protein
MQRFLRIGGAGLFRARHITGTKDLLGMFTCLRLAGHKSVAASWILDRIAFLPGESGQQRQAANPQSNLVYCHGS